MEALRTPAERFEGLPDFPFEPRYVRVEGLRIAWVEAGPPDGAPVLLLHGEPSWSFLYRSVIPGLAAAGLRAIAPDLPGFGRSDKPSAIEDYSSARLVAWTEGWMDAVGLDDVTLFGQDWGAIVGLRMAANRSERFARVAVGNGFLPTGRGAVSLPFRAWRLFARWSPLFPAGRIVQLGTARRLSRFERRAYDAPFPDASHQAGARALPRLVPTAPDDEGAAENRRAWAALGRWQKPFLTAFSDGDPITRGLDRPMRERVPGARGREHATLRGAGHFLQEDRGPELARVLADFVLRTG